MDAPTTSHILWPALPHKGTRLSLPSTLTSLSSFSVYSLGEPLHLYRLPQTMFHTDSFSKTARKSILAALEDCIVIGSLVVEDAGNTYRFGDCSVGQTPVHLKVINPSFWTQVLK